MNKTQKEQLESKEGLTVTVSPTVAVKCKANENGRLEYWTEEFEASCTTVGEESLFDPAGMPFHVVMVRRDKVGHTPNFVKSFRVVVEMHADQKVRDASVEQLILTDSINEALRYHQKKEADADTQHIYRYLGRDNFSVYVDKHYPSTTDQTKKG